MSGKWTPAQRKKFQATMAKKRKAKKNEQSFPLDAIPDRPVRKERAVKVTKALEGEVLKAWQAPPLRVDEASIQRARMDILFGLISLASKVL